MVSETVAAGGKLIIPIFAIERAQELIYHLNRLLEARHIPEVPVFLDSPMAADVNEVFRHHRECFDAEAEQMVAAGESLLKFPSLRVVRSVEESKAINNSEGPGRHHGHLGHVYGGPHQAPPGPAHRRSGLHDPVRRLPVARHAGPANPRRQPGGPHPRPLPPGPRPGRQIQGISGHADRTGLLKWLGHFQQPPRQLFITHGEPQASLAFAEQVRQQMGWNVCVPEYRETVTLDSEC